MKRIRLRTVQQLAEAIRQGGEEEAIAFLSRRIRHWALAGALRSVGERPSGLGRHRRFDREAIYVGAVLDALADLGMPIEALKLVGDGLYDWLGEVGGRRKLLDDAIAGSGRVYLLIDIKRSGPLGGRVTMQLETPARIVARKGHMTFQEVPLVVVLDLTATLSAVEADE